MNDRRGRADHYRARGDISLLVPDAEAAAIASGLDFAQSLLGVYDGPQVRTISLYDDPTFTLGGNKPETRSFTTSMTSPGRLVEGEVPFLAGSVAADARAILSPLPSRLALARERGEVSSTLNDEAAEEVVAGWASADRFRMAKRPAEAAVGGGGWSWETVLVA